MTKRQSARSSARLLAAALALVAGACATEADRTGETAPATIEGTSATRTIEHALGGPEIPAEPRRVVVLNQYSLLDYLLPVGVRPIGSTGDPAADYPYRYWLQGIDADVLFIYSAANAELEPENAEARQALRRHPLWENLSAVRNGRVHFVDSFLWAGGGVLWAERMLDDLLRYLVEGS